MLLLELLQLTPRTLLQAVYHLDTCARLELRLAQLTQFGGELIDRRLKLLNETARVCVCVRGT